MNTASSPNSTPPEFRTRNDAEKDRNNTVLFRRKGEIHAALILSQNLLDLSQRAGAGALSQYNVPQASDANYSQPENSPPQQTVQAQPNHINTAMASAAARHEAQSAKDTFSSIVEGEFDEKPDATPRYIDRLVEDGVVYDQQHDAALATAVNNPGTAAVFDGTVGGAENPQPRQPNDLEMTAASRDLVAAAYKTEAAASIPPVQGGYQEHPRAAEYGTPINLGSADPSLVDEGSVNV